MTYFSHRPHTEQLGNTNNLGRNSRICKWLFKKHGKLREKAKASLSKSHGKQDFFRLVFCKWRKTIWPNLPSEKNETLPLVAHYCSFQADTHTSNIILVALLLLSTNSLQNKASKLELRSSSKKRTRYEAYKQIFIESRPLKVHKC